MMQNNIEETKYAGPATYNDYDSSGSDDGRANTTSASKRNVTSKGQRKRLGRDYVKNAFTINTTYCRTELETIQHIIKLSGFAEVTA